jgi:hypothetical protein
MISNSEQMKVLIALGDKTSAFLRLLSRVVDPDLGEGLPMPRQIDEACKALLEAMREAAKYGIIDETSIMRVFDSYCTMMQTTDDNPTRRT